MIFGAPIVLNPMLLIPFIVIPLVLATIAWVATAMHLVNCAVTIAPWTLPGPIGAYLACGGDWRAAVLNIILIVISVVLTSKIEIIVNLIQLHILYSVSMLNIQFLFLYF